MRRLGTISAGSWHGSGARTRHIRITRRNGQVSLVLGARVAIGELISKGPDCENPEE